MIIRGVWKWNQDAGQRKAGELRQAGRARSRNDKISGAVHFLHLMMKRTDVSRNIFPAIVVCNQAFIPRAGEVDHLERHTLQERQRFD